MGRNGVNATPADAAPARAVRTRRVRGPRVSVRAYYEALRLISSLDAGRVKAGESRPDQKGLITRARPRKHGPEGQKSPPVARRKATRGDVGRPSQGDQHNRDTRPRCALRRAASELLGRLNSGLSNAAIERL